MSTRGGNRVMRTLRGVLLTMAAAAALAVPAPAHGAGMTTHAWMAEAGISHVRIPELRALLIAQRDTVLTGAAYPDSGYSVSSYPGGDYGEVSHWERFINAYVAHIRSKPECRAVLADPTGPCAALIAHMLGSAAHGLGDETWDWMFESQMPDHGEHPHDRDRVDDQPGWAQLGEVPVAGSTAQEIALEIDRSTIGNEGNPFGSLVNSPEYNMDAIAIADHGRVAWGARPFPIEDLLSVYRAIGRDDITADGLAAGYAAVNAVQGAQRLSVVDASSIRISMPWSSANFVRERGGVDHTGRMIAGYYEALWRKLTGSGHPPLRVVGVSPLHGTRGVPTGWGGLPENQTFAGPHGSGDKRVIAVLSNGFDPSGPRHRPGYLRVLDPNGDEVPIRAGFPRTGPYGGDGVHSIMWFARDDLAPCATYTVEVTTQLTDHAGDRLDQPYRWKFTTAGC